MKYGLSELDHVVCVVCDAQDAGDRLAALGFTVAPLSKAANVGVMNRMILLRPAVAGAANFIEVMSIFDRERVAPGFRRFLEGGRGYRWIVASGADAAESFEQLLAAGYAFEPPLRVRREWALPDGEILQVAFDVALPIDAPVAFNFCAYRTLHHYLRADFLTHANGALSLTEILCSTNQPERVLGYFGALFGAAAQRVGDHLHAVTPGRTRLLVGTDEGWHAMLGEAFAPGGAGETRVFGCRIRTRSLRQTDGYLRGAGVATLESPFGLAIDSPLADGTLFVFH